MIPKTDGDVMAQAVLLTDWVGEADSSLILTLLLLLPERTHMENPLLSDTSSVHICNPLFSSTRTLKVKRRYSSLSAMFSSHLLAHTLTQLKLNMDIPS